MVKMLGKRIKIVDKFVDPVWIFLFFFLNLTVFLIFVLSTFLSWAVIEILSYVPGLGKAIGSK